MWSGGPPQPRPNSHSHLNIRADPSDTSQRFAGMFVSQDAGTSSARNGGYFCALQAIASSGDHPQEARRADRLFTLDMFTGVHSHTGVAVEKPSLIESAAVGNHPC